jgi:cob(I)alamin adenosyltransferase
MGQIATLPEDVARYPYAKISADDVAWLESVAKEMESRGVRYTDWARPGAEGAMGSAALDLARAVARRAERHGWQLHEQGGEVSIDVRLFLNRLSDLLWIMARVEAKDRG